MLEDDQRFEELESKLAALSSQVESLELDTELDPFSEDDVRRTVEYFKSLELAGLESEDEGFEDDESSSSDDFISVQTTGGPSFKTHWIAPTSCENMTRDLARDAFVQGAVDRYGTSQQVNNGDVLILLCREAAGEEPEEGSEPAEPAAPKEICRYIGLAYNTLIHPASAEPTSATEESISAPVGNYEILVWSSCECSGEPAETVVLPSIFEASSESSDNGNYASIGDDASPDMSNADGLLTETSLRKSQDTSSSNLAKGLSNTLEKTDAGYKAQLVQLSQELSRYHLDQKKNQLNFKADKKNLNTHGFGSDLFVSKNLTLSNGACGNLETVSIAGETFDLALLKEGGGTPDSTFLTTAKISLGTAVSIGGTFNLDVYDTNADDLDTDLELVEGSTVFLPVITEEMADKIENSDTLNTQSFSLTGANVTSDSSGVTVSIGTSASTITANYSSGLLTHKNSPAPSLGNISFTLPNVSVGNGNNSDISFREVTDVTVRGEYDVIYESEGTGDARYYVDHTYKDVTIDIENGLVAGSEKRSVVTSYGTKPIVVPGAELRYSCDPVYGCMPDPAGEYDEDTCGGNCGDSSSTTPLLTFRPAKIYRLDPQNVGGLPSCRVLEVWTRSGSGGPSSHTYESDGTTNTLEQRPEGYQRFNNYILNEISEFAYYSSSPC